MNKESIIERIKNKVHSIDPDATVILYGSYARGDFRKDSDIDLLILIDKKEVTREDEKRIKYPLYDIEFDTGVIISPLVYARDKWETPLVITPFYENVIEEGIVL
ncbi:MAG: nucleotidyltransferase domain-containing protein [Cyclobacteriaceae bacterium]|nr:nucleotidyltransferase domain-containing protein [Cyclobacteriaceae bacterium]